MMWPGMQRGLTGLSTIFFTRGWAARQRAFFPASGLMRRLEMRSQPPGGPTPGRGSRADLTRGEKWV